MSRMLWVAAGLAATIAVVFGGLYALPDSEEEPVGGGGKAVAFDQALADKGEQVATSNGCTACHSTDGAKGVGPTWKGTWGTQAELDGGETVPVDEVFVKTAIIDPAAQVRSGFGAGMQSYEGKLTDEDIKAFAEYMKSLSG